MKKLLFVLMMVSGSLFAQENIINLAGCYESMLVNYPLANQNIIYQESSELNMQNLKAGWLPNADLNAKATYQSDAMEVDIQAIGTSYGFAVEKTQYQATIDVNQLIYDWGRIKHAKNLESADLEVKKQSTQVELNKLKEQINVFYFSILILQKNEELLNAMLYELENQEQMVESAVNNGLMLSSDLSALKAEKLNVKQSIIEVINQRLAIIQMLSEITGKELSSDVKLEVPEFDVNANVEISRPEYQLFDLQLKKADASSELISKQNSPLVYSFAQIGYGKPGINMVNNEFDSFYIVGAGLSWNIWDWNQTKREKQVALINKGLISTQKETFDRQLQISMHNEFASIATLQSTILADSEIIKLREEVTESARSKLENGVVTSTDYITELTAETKAKISHETHKLQLIQSKVNYLYLKGEL